jgi:nitrogen PTS system EIIA component
MILERILKPENVLCDVSARGKKHCLEMLSELLANSAPGLPHEDIFAKLAERERLGSTGLGGGVALPHCRFAGIDETNGALLRLAEAVDFESGDGEPVDLVFGMMVPEEITDSHRDHIEKISAMLKDPAVQAQLRSARTPSALYSRFIYGHTSADDIPGRRKQSLGPGG